MPHDIVGRLLWRLDALGDLGVALPVAGVLLCWFLVHGRWRAGLWWATAVLGCVIFTFLAKLGFHSGRLSIPDLALDNPSGHSAMSAVVYGSIAWVVSRELQGSTGRVLLVSGWLGVASIGAALCVLGAHTLAEVIVGLALGGAWAGVFVLFGYRPVAPVTGQPLRLMLAIAIAVITLQGLHIAMRLVPTDLVLLPPGAATRL